MNPIIVTPRRILPRLFDHTVSGIAWLALIGLSASELPVSGHVTLAQQGYFSAFVPAVQTVLMYLLIGGFNALLMVLWAHYHLAHVPHERRDAPTPCDMGLLAAHFDVSSGQLSAIQGSRMATIHHTDGGSITGIVLEPDPSAIRFPASPAASASEGLDRKPWQPVVLGHPADHGDARLTHEAGAA